MHYNHCHRATAHLQLYILLLLLSLLLYSPDVDSVMKWRTRDVPTLSRSSKGLEYIELCAGLPEL